MLYLGYAAYWIDCNSRLMTAIDLNLFTDFQERVFLNGPISKSNGVVLPLRDRSFVTLFRIKSLALTGKRLDEIQKSPSWRHSKESLGTPYGVTLTFVGYDRCHVYPAMWNIVRDSSLARSFIVRESEISSLIISSPDPLRVLRDRKESVYVK